MKKKRIALIIILLVLLLLAVGGGVFAWAYRWENVGKRPFRGVITEENVGRITVCENVFMKDAEETELKPGSQAFMLACLFADDLTVYLPPKLLFNLPREIIYGENSFWEIAYYMKDGSVHRIREDISENTAPIKTEYFVFIDGERYYISKDQEASYHLEVDGKRFRVADKAIVREFADVVKKGIK